VPIATYAYAGVEIVAVTALEARDCKAVRGPAYWVPPIIFATYALGSIGFYLNVSWENPMLPSTLKRATGGTTTGVSILIIAAKESGIPHLAGFFNAALIMTVFSSANTALYVASRILYGLARDFEVGEQGTFWRKWIAGFGKTSHVNKVPIGAVLMSFILFFWLPALHMAIPDQSVCIFRQTSDLNADVRQFQEILSGIATVSVVLVWSAQCLAFIRYRKW
jgi:amino acid transporter